MKNLLYLLVAFALLQGCAPKTESGVNDENYCKKETCIDNDYMLMSVIYYQKAAENRALYYQAFNTAKMSLDIDLKDGSKDKKAIVLDIDETVLNNSPYEAKCIQEKINYPEKWNDWCNLAQAEACPGAVEFTTYAAEKGYEVYYITNRKENLKEATLKNLNEKGFPMADESHVIFRSDEPSKESRRNKVSESCKIVMLLGDNLGDFCSIYDQHLDSDKRASVTDSLKAEFGRKFIILPNPMYGEWELVLFSDMKACPFVKDSIRKNSLKGF